MGRITGEVRCAGVQMRVRMVGRRQEQKLHEFVLGRWRQSMATVRQNDACVAYTKKMMTGSSWETRLLTMGVLLESYEVEADRTRRGKALTDGAG